MKNHIEISSFTGGLNKRKNPLEIEENQFQVFKNVNIDEEGIASKEKGVNVWSEKTKDEPCDGIHYFSQNVYDEEEERYYTEEHILKVTDGELYVGRNGVFDAEPIYTNFEPGERVVFSEINNMVFMCDGYGEMVKYNPASEIQPVTTVNVEKPEEELMTATTELTGILDGDYKYVVTFVTETSESLPTEIPVEITADEQNITLENIPISDNPSVIGRNIYRTTGTGAVFMLVLPDADNDMTIEDNETQTLTDEVPDAQLRREVDYQSGKPVEGLKTIANYNNILFGAGNPDVPHRLYFSKMSEPEKWFALNFLDFQEDFVQPIQAIETEHDRLYVFKNQSIYAVAGTGLEDLESMQLMKNLGTPGQNCIDSFNGFVSFIDMSGKIQSFGGGGNKRLDIPVEPLVAEIDNFDNVVLFYDSFGRLNIAYDFEGDVDIIVYNFQHEAWSEHTQNPIRCVSRRSEDTMIAGLSVSDEVVELYKSVSLSDANIYIHATQQIEYSVLGTSDDNVVAQHFSANQTGYASSSAVRIRRDPDTNLGKVRGYLYNSDGSEISTKIVDCVDEIEIKNLSSDFQWITFHFEKEIKFDRGETYAFVIEVIAEESETIEINPDVPNPEFEEAELVYYFVDGDTEGFKIFETNPTPGEEYNIDDFSITPAIYEYTIKNSRPTTIINDGINLYAFYMDYQVLFKVDLENYKMDLWGTIDKVGVDNLFVVNYDGPTHSEQLQMFDQELWEDLMRMLEFDRNYSSFMATDEETEEEYLYIPSPDGLFTNLYIITEAYNIPQVVFRVINDMLEYRKKITSVLSPEEDEEKTDVTMSFLFEKLLENLINLYDYYEANIFEPEDFGFEPETKPNNAHGFYSEVGFKLHSCIQIAKTLQVQVESYEPTIHEFDYYSDILPEEFITQCDNLGGMERQFHAQRSLTKEEGNPLRINKTYLSGYMGVEKTKYFWIGGHLLEANRQLGMVGADDKYLYYRAGVISATYADSGDDAQELLDSRFIEDVNPQGSSDMRSRRLYKIKKDTRELISWGRFRHHRGPFGGNGANFIKGRLQGDFQTLIPSGFIGGEDARADNFRDLIPLPLSEAQKQEIISNVLEEENPETDAEFDEATSKANAKIQTINKSITDWYEQITLPSIPYFYTHYSYGGAEGDNYYISRIGFVDDELSANQFGYDMEGYHKDHQGSVSGPNSTPVLSNGVYYNYGENLMYCYFAGGTFYSSLVYHPFFNTYFAQVAGFRPPEFGGQQITDINGNPFQIKAIASNDMYLYLLGEDDVVRKCPMIQWDTRLIGYDFQQFRIDELFWKTLSACYTASLMQASPAFAGYLLHGMAAISAWIYVAIFIYVLTQEQELPDMGDVYSPPPDELFVLEEFDLKENITNTFSFDSKYSVSHYDDYFKQLVRYTSESNRREGIDILQDQGVTDMAESWSHYYMMNRQTRFMAIYDKADMTRVYDSETPTQSPAGLDVDADGYVWYLDSARKRISKLHPQTFSIIESHTIPINHPDRLAVNKAYDEEGKEVYTFFTIDRAGGDYKKEILWGGSDGEELLVEEIEVPSGNLVMLKFVPDDFYTGPTGEKFVVRDTGISRPDDITASNNVFCYFKDGVNNFSRIKDYGELSEPFLISHQLRNKEYITSISLSYPKLKGFTFGETGEHTENVELNRGVYDIYGTLVEERLGGIDGKQDFISLATRYEVPFYTNQNSFEVKYEDDFSGSLLVGPQEGGRNRLQKGIWSFEDGEDEKPIRIDWKISPDIGFGNPQFALDSDGEFIYHITNPGGEGYIVQAFSLEDYSRVPEGDIEIHEDIIEEYGWHLDYSRRYNNNKIYIACPMSNSIEVANNITGEGKSVNIEQDYIRSPHNYNSLAVTPFGFVISDMKTYKNDGNRRCFLSAFNNKVLLQGNEETVYMDTHFQTADINEKEYNYMTRNNRFYGPWNDNQYPVFSIAGTSSVDSDGTLLQLGHFSNGRIRISYDKQEKEIEVEWNRSWANARVYFEKDISDIIGEEEYFDFLFINNDEEGYMKFYVNGVEIEVEEDWEEQSDSNVTKNVPITVRNLLRCGAWNKEIGYDSAFSIINRIPNNWTNVHENIFEQYKDDGLLDAFSYGKFDNIELDVYTESGHRKTIATDLPADSILKYVVWSDGYLYGVHNERYVVKLDIDYSAGTANTVYYWSLPLDFCLNSFSANERVYFGQRTGRIYTMMLSQFGHLDTNMMEHKQYSTCLRALDEGNNVPSRASIVLGNKVNYIVDDRNRELAIYDKRVPLMYSRTSIPGYYNCLSEYKLVPEQDGNGYKYSEEGVIFTDD